MKCRHINDYRTDLLLVYIEETRERRLPPRINKTDYSPWLEELLCRVGLEYQKGITMIRIFGYSPKSYDLFDQ
jgi:hypothetical protein